MKQKIIVEICQNHNGDRKVLRDLIHSAAENGADIIKGQVIFSDDLTHRERFDAGKTDDDGVVKVIKRPFGAEQERLAKLDLTPEDYAFFIEEVYKAGATPMLTVFSRNRVQFASKLPWKKGEKLVKVASYDCASYPMLQELTENFDELIVSTGASFDEEIKEAADILKHSGKKFSLLHCVTSYPNTLDMCHLARVEWLRQFSDSVGWSDHSLVARDGIKAAKVAFMLGAEYVERHYTVLASDKTKDGPVSITPELLKELSEFRNKSAEEKRKIVEREIPEWKTLIGLQKRELTHTELLNRDYYRGRFASKVGKDFVYNWEDRPLK